MNLGCHTGDMAGLRGRLFRGPEQLWIPLMKGCQVTEGTGREACGGEDSVCKCLGAALRPCLDL